MTPSISPAAKIANAWYDYALNNINPTDPFYGKTVVPQLEFQRGGWTSTKPMVEWTIKTAGLGVVVDQIESIHDGATTRFTSKSIPFWNKIVRESNGGETDYYKRISENIASDRAAELIEQKGIIKKHVKNIINSDDPKANYNKELTLALNEFNKSKTKQIVEFKTFAKRFKTAYMYGLESPHTQVVSAVLSSRSTDEKVAIINGYYEIEDFNSYQSLKKYLVSEGIISKDVLSKIK